MYTSFFGLSDTPFSIAPNPDYLFLGDRHTEALAHLSYGLGETGGFVLLTGEVGTGKTTISRRLLDQLPEHTQVASILNPMLSCLELLATICDELKIRYKKTGTTLKYLTDKIQDKLLKNQAENISTLLIIDEAQHLQPEVLEQLRLLTNLETNTKKLLQVILIGQPELQQLLQRRDLRQLAQRITARYHLLPLTQVEVSSYIKHRLSVADCHRMLFKPSAIKRIHQISQGIPRLINLLCDRALANAYGANESMVTAKTVVLASQQALGSEYQLSPWWKSAWFIVPTFVASLAVLTLTGYLVGTRYGGSLNDDQEQNKIATKTTTELPIKNTESNQKDLAVDIDDVASAEVKNTNDIEPLQVATLPPQIEDHITSESTTVSQPISEQLDNSQPVTSQLVDDKAHLSEQQLSEHQQAKQPVTFDIEAIEGVSEELLAKVQDALAQEQNQAPVEEGSSSDNQQEVISLLDMPPSVQAAVPALEFQVHIFASDGNGWVRVNGRERYEGDKVAGEVVLSRILQDKVILSLNGQEFSLPALSSW